MTQSPVTQKNQKAKIIVLTGFLGAGKTTLLKQILSSETDLKGTVVIINEFGDVGIDGMLTKDHGSGVVELAGGCICCTLRTALHEALRRIWDEFRPERIIIEASGVADAGAIMNVLNHRALSEHMDINKVIAVLDADAWVDRDAFGSFFMSQLREAEMILLNKIDTVEQERIPVILKEVHEMIPDAKVLPTVHCKIEPESLWVRAHPEAFDGEEAPFFDAGADLDEDRAFHHHDHPGHGSGGGIDHRHDTEALGYVTFDFRSKEPLNEGCFMALLRELPWELFRMKGPVRFEDRTAMLNYVGGKSEWTAWADQEETRLAFVGLKVNADEIIDRIRECLCSR